MSVKVLNECKSSQNQYSTGDLPFIYTLIQSKLERQI